jgi:hypothetical protein
MDIKVLNNSNLISLSAVYGLDSNIQLNNSSHNSYHGINLTLNNILSSTKDTTVNNYSSFYLSGDTSYGKFLTFDMLNLPVEYTFTTYIATIDAAADDPSSLYLTPAAAGNTATSTLSFTNTLSTNKFFEVYFIDKQFCKIKTAEGSINRYITYDYVSSSIILLTGSDATASNDLNTFEYVYNNTSNTIVFYKKIFDKVQYLTHDIGNNTLIFQEPSTTSKLIPFKQNQIFTVRLNPSAITNTLSTSNYVYEESLNNAKLTIDENKSLYNFDSNFIFNAQYYDINPYISTKLNLNILNLKNQKTVFNTQSHGNTIAGQPKFKHRYYENLFTGVNQEAGNSNIGIGFASYTLTKVLKSDNLNYFHIPYDIYPYGKLNINDSSLISSGAIPSDTPYYADKVFKRLNGYRDSSPYGNTTDTQTGAYLCTWLSGGSDINNNGMWVDRYYNPTNISHYQALNNPSEGLLTNYSEISGDTNLDYIAYDIYDTKSNLTFETGALYAYHHIGSSNCQSFVNRLSSHYIFNNFDCYFDKSYNYNAFVDSIKFEYDNFAKLSYSPLTNYNNFTITFDINNKDWSRPFGSQIIGNYTQKGFGIFNYRRITPYSVIYDGNKISVLNTNGKVLRNIYTDENIIAIQKFEPNSIFLVFDDTGHVSKYNYIGTVLDKKYISEIDVNDNVNFYSYGDYVFILVGLVWYRLNIYSLDIESSTALDYNTIYIGQEDISSILVKDDNVYVLSGSNPKLYGSEAYFYNYPNLFYYNIDTREFGIKVEANIQDYTFDINGTIYILHDSTTITSIDTSDIITFSDKLSSVTNFEYSYGKSIDLIDEFYNNLKIDNYLSIVSLSSNNTDGLPIYTRTNVEFTNSTNNIIGDIVTLSNYNNNYNINNYDYLRNNYDEGNNIQAKIKLPNIYDTQTYETATVMYPLSNISPGYHNITITFDSVNGMLNMIVDGKSVSIYGFNPSKYSYGRLLENSMYVGTEPGYGNDKLNDDLYDVNYYNYGKFEIKNMYMYNKSLYLYDIANIIRSRYDIQDMLFELPTGKRSYVENISKFFMHKLPGRKSNLINIGLQDTSISHDDLRQDIDNEIVASIKTVLPGNTNLNKIVWEKDND